MSKKHKRNKVITSVALEPEVRELLDFMKQEDERDGSYLVSLFIRNEWQRRQERARSATSDLFAHAQSV